MPSRTWTPRLWVSPLLILLLMVATASGLALDRWPAQLRIAPGESLPAPAFPFHLGLPEAQAGTHAPAAEEPAAEEPAVRGSVAGAGSAAVERSSPASPASWRLPVQLGPWTVRSVDVRVVARTVVPGGDSIGVLLAHEGLVVAAVQTLTGSDGRRYAPAREAGIQPGDLLLRVNGQRVAVPGDVSVLVEGLAERGEPVPLELRRGDETLRVAVRPVAVALPRPGGGVHTVHMIGLLLQDPVAGVGTLSFYDPATGMYGALGHQVVDGQGQPARMTNGRIVSAYISTIEPGWRGMPGEKVGVFHDHQLPLGTIDLNTRFGIFGRWVAGPGDRQATGVSSPTASGTMDTLTIRQRQPIPVALAHQVREGPAQMLTVLHGQEVEAFQVVIERVVPQRRPADKGLVVHVTDPRLLAQSSGIVQGMSGSPLIQQGKLIGVVTHVFVNDPTRGYGILADWMLEEAGLWQTAAAAPPPVGNQTPSRRPMSPAALAPGRSWVACSPSGANPAGLAPSAPPLADECRVEAAPHSSKTLDRGTTDCTRTHPVRVRIATEYGTDGRLYNACGHSQIKRRPPPRGRSPPTSARRCSLCSNPSAAADPASSGR